MKPGILTLALVALALPVPVRAAAPCAVPSASHPTIQAAVNDTACDPITVAAGSYDDGAVVDRDVAIVGAGADLTLISDSGGLSLSVDSTSEVTLRGVTLARNSTAILNQGVLTLEGVVIRDNTGSGGGAGIVTSTGATTVIRASVLSGNTVSGDHGGAIKSTDNADTLTIEDSVLVGNSASMEGGAIWGGGEITLTNTTITGNRSGRDGGGIHSHGTLTLINVTITTNISDHDGGSGGGNGGGLATAGGTVTVKSSIISGNRDASPVSGAPDCWATVTSLGHNLIGTTDGCAFSASDGDTVGVDPQLGPLDNYGGPTFSHSPLPGSPAIDGVGSGACSDGAITLSADQRGVARPVDGNGDGLALCDVGAVEWAPRELELRARNKVAEGKKVKLTARVSPCTGNEDDTVRFLRGSRRIGSMPLGEDCKVSKKAKVTRTTKFTAKLQPEVDHPGDADKEKVKVR